MPQPEKAAIVVLQVSQGRGQLQALLYPLCISLFPGTCYHFYLTLYPMFCYCTACCAWCSVAKAYYPKGWQFHDSLVQSMMENILDLLSCFFEDTCIDSCSECASHPREVKFRASGVNSSFTFIRMRGSLLMLLHCFAGSNLAGESGKRY